MMANQDWELRELHRFASGAYSYLPWEKKKFNPRKHRDFVSRFGYDSGMEPIPNHYAHVSTTNPSLVAYTADDYKGNRDIQTQMKPGRYLHNFYGDLPNDAIAYLSALLRISIGQGKDNELLFFAKTEDEIEELYLNGPCSCMSHSCGSGEEEFDTRDYHPVRVYAGPDLAVAYVKNKDRRTAARVVVWPEKKIYSRIYGDGGAYAAQLKSILAGMGYSYGQLYGARLLRVKHKDLYVCPYIDDADDDAWVKDDGTYLVIGTGFCKTDNVMNAKVTTGYADDRERNPECESCGDAYDPEEDGDTFSLCPSCYSDTYIECALCNESAERDLSHYVVAEDSYVCENCHTSERKSA